MFGDFEKHRILEQVGLAFLSERRRHIGKGCVRRHFYSLFFAEIDQFVLLEVRMNFHLQFFKYNNSEKCANSRYTILFSVSCT